MIDQRKITETLLSTSRLSVHYLRCHCHIANAPRVLFLGGSNFDLRLKRQFLTTPLAMHCELATYEPRGIGRTEQPVGDWDMNDYAEDALAVLDVLQWQNAHIIGESFGGMTALHFAYKYPSRVKKLIIASATAGGDEHASFDIREFLDLPRLEAAQQAMCLQDTRMKTLQSKDPHAFAEALTQRHRFEQEFANPSIRSGGYARLLHARAKHDCSKVVKDISNSTEVIAGKFDRQANPASQEALANSLPNARFHLFDAGHGVLFQSPQAVQCALDSIKQFPSHSG